VISIRGSSKLRCWIPQRGRSWSAGWSRNEGRRRLFTRRFPVRRGWGWKRPGRRGGLSTCCGSKGTSCGSATPVRSARRGCGSRRRLRAMRCIGSICCSRTAFRRSGSPPRRSGTCGNCCGSGTSWCGFCWGKRRRRRREPPPLAALRQAQGGERSRTAGVAAPGIPPRQGGGPAGRDGPRTELGGAAVLALARSHTAGSHAGQPGVATAPGTPRSLP